MTKQPGLRRMLIVTLAALCSIARNSAAQDPPLARIGSRIRLTLQGVRPPIVTGLVMEFGPDSLIIADAKTLDRTVLLRSTIRQVEISLRQESQVARGLALGAVSGTLFVGAIALTIAATTPACGTPSARLRWCHSITAGKLLAGIGLGAAAGAELGYERTRKHPRDVWTLARWPEAAPRPSSTLQPLLGLGRVGDHRVLFLGLSFSRRGGSGPTHPTSVATPVMFAEGDG